MSEKKGYDRIFYGASGKTDLNFSRGSAKGQTGRKIFDFVQFIDPLNEETFFSGGAFEDKKADQPFFAYLNIECSKAHGFDRAHKWAVE